MELLVPVWGPEKKDTDLRLEYVSQVDPEELKKPLIRVPITLSVPRWSNDDVQQAPSFSIELLEEQEGGGYSKLIPQKMPMLLPLFPWNTNSRFSAVSGLLEPWAYSNLPLSRDLMSPVLISESQAAPIPSMPQNLVSPAPVMTAQIPYSSPVLPGLRSAPESNILPASQLETSKGISTSLTVPANQAPYFNPSHFLQNTLPPQPRYGIQTTPHLPTALESTAQASYRTKAPSVTQETRSVPADESNLRVLPAEQPRPSSDERTEQQASKAPRLPPIPPLIPIANRKKDADPRVFPANGSVRSRDTATDSSVQNGVSPEIVSSQKQVSAAKDLVQRPVSPEIETVRNQIFATDDSVKGRAFTDIQSVESQIFTDSESVESQVFSQIDSVKSKVHTRIDSVKGKVHPRIESLQSQLFAEHSSVQNLGRNTTTLPPFTSSFPNHSALVSSRESQPIVAPGKTQTPARISTAPSVSSRVPPVAPSSAVSPSSLQPQRTGSEKPSVLRISDLLTLPQSYHQATKQRKGPPSVSSVPVTSTSSTSTSSNSQPGALMQSENSRKRHIPLVPTPTFSSSKLPKTASLTKYKNIINSKNRPRIVKLPHGSVAPVSTDFSASAPTPAKTTTTESRVNKRSSVETDSSEYTTSSQSSVLTCFQMTPRDRVW